MKYLIILTLFLAGCADYKAGRQAYRDGNYEQAKENLEPLALNYGHTKSQVELADLYLKIEPAETHGDQVRDLLAEAAPVEQGKSYYLQGKIYEEGYGVPIDGQRAVELYQKASETGYWKADYYIGRLFDRGELVPQNYDRAEDLYETVINEHSYDNAKDDLLRLRAKRAVQNSNVAEAEKYFKQLIQMGDEKYTKKLADLYRDNITDGSKDSEIVNLYTQVAQKDESGKGWFNLGRIYEEGELKTVEANGLKAYGNYKKALDLGYGRASYFIGRLYDRGTLIQQNRKWAKQYYEIALQYEDYTPARNALVKVQEKIARDQNK